MMHAFIVGHIVLFVFCMRALSCSDVCVCACRWFVAFIQIKEKQQVRDGLGNGRISGDGLGRALWMFPSG